MRTEVPLTPGGLGSEEPLCAFELGGLARDIPQAAPVLDARAARGQTALRLAASVGNLAMVQALINARAGALPPRFPAALVVRRG